MIKIHHNVGGLPAELGFTSLVEPLRMLFKDECESSASPSACRRAWCTASRSRPGAGHPRHRRADARQVRIVRESDKILRDEIARSEMNGKISQYFTVLTGARSVA